MARWKRLLIRLAVGLGVLLILAAAGLELALRLAPTRSFQPFEGTTRIEITDNLDSPPKTIRDPSRVGQIAAYVNRFPDRWGGSADVFGTPVPTVVVNFYRADKFQGHFGAGGNFFETQRDGTFASRVVSEKDIRGFRELVGVPE
jgi:hypothetical protein